MRISTSSIDRSAWEDAADGFLEFVGAPDLAAGGSDPREGGGLRVGQLLGPLEHAPAGVLEALCRLYVTGAAQLVPVRAADLVQRLVGELHHVIWIDANDRSRRVLAGRGGVPVAHVQRDRPKLGGTLTDDRLAVLTAWTCVERQGCGDLGVELFEEPIGGLLARPVGSPHDLPALVVGHEREVVVLALPADLVDPDVEQVVEPAGIELVVADALDDPPDRVPVDPQHPLDRRLVGARRKPRVRVEPGRVAALSGDCFPDPLSRTGRASPPASGSPVGNSSDGSTCPNGGRRRARRPCSTPDRYRSPATDTGATGSPRHGPNRRRRTPQTTTE